MESNEALVPLGQFVISHEDPKRWNPCVVQQHKMAKAFARKGIEIFIGGALRDEDTTTGPSNKERIVLEARVMGRDIYTGQLEAVVSSPSTAAASKKGQGVIKKNDQKNKRIGVKPQTVAKEAQKIAGKRRGERKRKAKNKDGKAKETQSAARPPASEEALSKRPGVHISVSFVSFRDNAVEADECERDLTMLCLCLCYLKWPVASFQFAPDPQTHFTEVEMGGDMPLPPEPHPLAPPVSDSSSSEIGAPEEQQEWEVKEVVGNRTGPDGKPEYQLTFEGFGSKRYWTRAEDMDCDELVAEFFKKMEGKRKGKKKGAPELNDPSIGAPEDEEEWEVKEAVGHRKGPDGKHEYLLHYEGFSNQSYWTKAEDMNCDELIAEFFKKMGKEVPDCADGGMDVDPSHPGNALIRNTMLRTFFKINKDDWRTIYGWTEMQKWMDDHVYGKLFGEGVQVVENFLPPKVFFTLRGLVFAHFAETQRMVLKTSEVWKGGAYTYRQVATRGKKIANRRVDATMGNNLRDASRLAHIAAALEHVLETEVYPRMRNLLSLHWQSARRKDARMYCNRKIAGGYIMSVGPHADKQAGHHDYSEDLPMCSATTNVFLNLVSMRRENSPTLYEFTSEQKYFSSAPENSAVLMDNHIFHRGTEHKEPSHRPLIYTTWTDSEKDVEGKTNYTNWGDFDITSPLVQGGGNASAREGKRHILEEIMPSRELLEARLQEAPGGKEALAKVCGLSSSAEFFEDLPSMYERARADDPRTRSRRAAANPSVLPDPALVHQRAVRDATKTKDEAAADGATLQVRTRHGHRELERSGKSVWH
uniref:Chromo domain-containing protein n=1 Tax=Chromera velia CCMP2878 TaxID=1169474 RepID=A0A0G4GCU7_9ALVE|eukprot:Cvel_21351.t1-p1 / transcript=Cvel_21351.t1 / gene=Cvel_21351 / organism=Chromera_velia_CCMP2878 / gene_product=hypothetical protein / transcript_product=hypothetical protein / location=Cvel_scaffold1994:7024-15026(+) / protein_length=815 / sequence_SO=supercontig / SO=protein_coding / is_pseudo=false